MRITHITIVAALLLLGSSIQAQETQPATQPAMQPATKSAAGAPSAETAKAVLDKSPRHGEWVDIALPGGEAKLHTWVVYPERKDKAPVVLVIHEIFGLSDWVRAVADQLAANGFVAVAPDFLSGKGPNGGGTESLGSNVGQTIRTLTPDDVARRLDAARDWAIIQPASNDKTATIGFCWGGGHSFNYATHQPKLNAAIVYYGSPPREKDALAKITGPVLGCYGGNDARITATVEPTTKTMAELNKTYKPNVYEGAGHGFLRQQTNDANKKAADQAWQETLTFLNANLNK